MGYTTNWGNVTVMWNMTIAIDKRQKNQSILGVAYFQTMGEH